MSTSAVPVADLTRRDFQSNPAALPVAADLRVPAHDIAFCFVNLAAACHRMASWCHNRRQYCHLKLYQPSLPEVDGASQSGHRSGYYYLSSHSDRPDKQKSSPWSKSLIPDDAGFRTARLIRCWLSGGTPIRSIQASGGLSRSGNSST